MMCRLLLLLLLACPAWATPPRILLLHSYHPQYSWTQGFQKGIKDGLAGHLPVEALHEEFMDARRFDGEVDEDLLLYWLASKYRKHQPDLVITTDDAAFELLRGPGKALFGKVPLLFMGVNIPPQQPLSANIGGLVEGDAIAANLQLIEQMLPNTRRIVLLSGSCQLGRFLAAKAKDQAESWRRQGHKAEIEVWDELDLEQLRSRLAALPSDTAALLLIIHKDAKGQYFSYEDVVPQLSRDTPVPLFAMWGPLLGLGVVGGVMNDPYLQGLQVAAMALDRLAGKPAVVESGDFYPRFDGQQLDRFAIDRDRLPSGSTLSGQAKPSQAGTALLMMTLLVVGLAAFAWQRYRHSLQHPLEARVAHLKARNKALTRLARKLDSAAHTDPLTGLPNRRACDLQLNQALASRQDKPLYLALLDLDHFKVINDSLGHDKGDQVLAAVALAMNQALDGQGSLFRWGGEEFLLLLRGLEKDKALALCEKLRAQIAALALPGLPAISVSVGLAPLSRISGKSAALRGADKALYQAKSLGRNRVQAQ
ncbi:sensor domain-containing diguanylate cyclase [Gallaecimonas xiamenensis]|nr:diguanylate cyclase [Gallaecimonas xiamenensis]